MISGTTKSGFKYTINEALRNDWRLLKAVADADSPDESRQMQGATQMVEILLGRDGEAALMKHVALPDGIVPADAIMAEMLEIFNHIGDELKNS